MSNQQERTQFQQAQLERLQHILEAIRRLSGTQQELADDLYADARSVLLTLAPTAHQIIWNLISSQHTRIMGETIQAFIPKNAVREPELTPDEEKLYQIAIEDGNGPFRLSYP